MDAIFQALAHPVRRDIVDYVMTHAGCNAGEVAEQFEISRIAIVKHIKILQQADLLLIEKQGRYSLHYFNAIPIQQIYDRWTDQYSQFFARKMTDFKAQLEQDTLDNQTEQVQEEHHEKIA